VTELISPLSSKEYWLLREPIDHYLTKSLSLYIYIGARED
jgi:hypothetical protein